MSKNLKPFFSNHIVDGSIKPVRCVIYIINKLSDHVDVIENQKVWEKGNKNKVK